MIKMEVDELQEGDLRENIREFPSIFNLENSRTNQNKLRSNNQYIKEEVKSAYDVQDEMILKLNFWTWIKFQLGETESAIEVNKRVMEMTNGENLIALSNRAHLMLNKGDEFEAHKCLQAMTEMKGREDFDLLRAAAEAGQAYCYLRLGGAKNLKRATDIFEGVISKVPHNYSWKFNLGLCYRRRIHINVYTSSQQKVTVRDYVEKAAKYLFEVGEKSVDVILKGRAYAELAALSRNARSNFDQDKCDAILKHKTFQDLCDNALKFGNEDPWVLTACGRILRFPQLEKAIELLEISVKLKKSSTAYHHLGLCYETIAKRKAREMVASIAETPCGDETVSRSNSCDETGRLNLWRNPLQEASLDADNEYVKKAIDCFQQSILASDEVNLVAAYNFGLLYKSCGQIETALIQFNKIINSPNFNDSNQVTLISAYEQAGLCLLELHSKTTSSVDACTEQKVNEKAKFLHNEAEKKLTKAVGLAAELAVTAPDLKDHAKNVWNAFRTLESELESKEPSPAVSKKLIRLLKLVQEHGKLLNVVQKLLSMSEDEIDDPVVIKSSLESYLALEQYENALALLNMVQTRPAAAQGKSKLWYDDPLFTKVYLDAAAARFKSGSGDAGLLFKTIFDSKMSVHTSSSTFGQNNVQDKGNKCEATENSPDQGDNKSAGEKEHPRSCEKKEPMTDVLILYDDFHDLDRSQDGVTQTARTLQSVMSNIFGLDASWNLQGCSCAGVKMELQLQEMLKSKVVIVLLGTEEMSGYFSGLLAYVPCLKVESERPPLPKVLLATTDETVTIKQTLQYFHDSICLKKIIPHLQQKTGADQSKSSIACSNYGTAEGSPQNDADISTSVKTAAVRRSVSCSSQDMLSHERKKESVAETTRKTVTGGDSPSTTSCIQTQSIQTMDETPLSSQTCGTLSTVDSSTSVQIADAKKLACSSSQKVSCCGRNKESTAEDRCTVSKAVHDDYSKELAGTMLDINLAAGTSTEISSSDKIPEVQTTKDSFASPVMYDQGEVITTRKAVPSQQLLPITSNTATVGGEACPAGISVMTALKQAEGSNFSCQISKATEVETLCKTPGVSEIDSSCELSMTSNIKTCQSITSTPDIDPCQPISSSDTGICPPDATQSPESIHEQQSISALMTLFTFLSGTTWEQKKAEL